VRPSIGLEAVIPAELDMLDGACESGLASSFVRPDYAGCTATVSMSISRRCLCIVASGRTLLGGGGGALIGRRPCSRLRHIPAVLTGLAWPSGNFVSYVRLHAEPRVSTPAVHPGRRRSSCGPVPGSGGEVRCDGVAMAASAGCDGVVLMTPPMLVSCDGRRRACSAYSPSISPPFRPFRSLLITGRTTPGCTRFVPSVFGYLLYPLFSRRSSVLKDFVWHARRTSSCLPAPEVSAFTPAPCARASHSSRRVDLQYPFCPEVAVSSPDVSYLVGVPGLLAI